MKRYLHADFLFTVSGFVILLSGLLFFHSSFDIAIHDTYLIVSHTHIAIALCAICLFFALIYFVFKKMGRPLFQIPGSIHYVLTLLPILTIAVIDVLPGRYIPNQNFSEEMQSAEKYNIIIAVTILLCMLGQLSFLINIGATLFKKGTGRQKN